MTATTICENCGTAGAGRFCAQCGSALTATESLPESVVTEGALKLLGISDAVKVLLTLHKPVSGLSSLLHNRKAAFKQALFAYIEFMLLVPTVLSVALLPIGRAVGYPLLVQGRAIDDQLIGSAVSAAGLMIAILIMYALPRSLFRPNGKTVVIAANMFISMYAMTYLALSDFAKLFLWSRTDDLLTVVYFGNAVFLALMAFQVFMMRRVLELRWHAIAIFVTVGLSVGFLWGYTLAQSGLVSYWSS